MAFTPVAGQFATVQVSTGNTAAAPLPAINWDLKLNANPKDVSNFRDGRRRWPTLGDWSMSLTLVYDSAANPVLPANGGIAQGTFVSIQCYGDSSNTNTKAWSGNGIVSSCNPKNAGVEDVIMYDAVIDANGQITMPTT